MVIATAAPPRLSSSTNHLKIFARSAEPWNQPLRCSEAPVEPAML